MVAQKGSTNPIKLMRSTMLVRATSIVDQEFAEKRENAEREFDKEHPGARDLLKAITGFDYKEKPIGS